MRRWFSFLTLAIITSLIFLVLQASAVDAAAGGNGHGHKAKVKMTFKLDSHDVAAGEMITGSVRVVSHAKGAKAESGSGGVGPWVPMAGVSVSVTIDKVEVATVVTDADGRALISVAPSGSGEHVMRTVFAGDELHKKAQRAQGFTAEAAPEPSPVPES